MGTATTRRRRPLDLTRFTIWPELQSGAGAQSLNLDATSFREGDNVRNVEILLARGIAMRAIVELSDVRQHVVRQIAAGQHPRQLSDAERAQRVARGRHRQTFLPTRKEIRVACQTIQSAWTEADRESRWMAARSFTLADEMLLRRMQAERPTASTHYEPMPRRREPDIEPTTHVAPHKPRVALRCRGRRRVAISLEQLRDVESVLNAGTKQIATAKRFGLGIRTVETVAAGRHRLQLRYGSTIQRKGLHDRLNAHAS